MTPYFEDAESGIVIYHGDCREVLPTLDSVDLVLTDPPYGIAHPTDYRSRGLVNRAPCYDYPPVYDDDKPFDPSLWLQWPSILWGANHYSSRLPDSSGWLVWDKMRPHDLDQATAELAFTNCIKGVRVLRHLWNGMIRASENGERYHPTQKPVALMVWCLEQVRAMSVLDPYMGSGPVLIAAKRLGRRAIGIEIEERYCEIAARRVMATPRSLFAEPAPAPVQTALAL